MHIGLSLVTDLGLQVYKTQTTNKQETFNVQVKSHPHIRFLPIAEFEWMMISEITNEIDVKFEKQLMLTVM